VEKYEGLDTSQLVEEMKKNKYIVNEQKKTVTYCDASGKCITKQYDRHFNTLDSLLLAKNKKETSDRLSQKNIPVPLYLEVQIQNTDAASIQKQIREKGISYPIVIKPVNGTFGRDVYTDITTTKELNEALTILKPKMKSAMIEEQIDGDCYRIFVFNNKVIDIIKREKPFVIGNGTDTVQTLIDKRNKEQVEMKLYEIKNISTIVIEKQGYTLHSILPKDKKLYISNVINMHNGARISRIPLDIVPSENMKLFLDVNRAMDITCSGLDYLSNDITQVYYTNGSKILEVNGTPDTEIHQKIPYPFFQKVTDSIFSS
jgi:cyanophycin synthetase